MTEGIFDDDSSSDGPTDSEQTDTELSDCEEYTEDRSRLLLLQQQLLLLLHALDCKIKDQKERTNGLEPCECSKPYCTILKGVIVHMDNCTAGPACSVKHCNNSRQILSHWERCVDSNNIRCQCCGFIIKGLMNSIEKDRPVPMGMISENLFILQGRHTRQPEEVSL